jgi:rhamnosyltransferase
VDVESNIKTYAGFVEHVFIVDNSDNNASFSCASIVNVTLVRLGENKGIAAALNVGFDFAKKSGFQFVLSMDQDSSFTEENIVGYLRMATDFFSNPKSAALGPSYSRVDKCQPTGVLKECKRVNVVVTSGCIVRMSAFEKIGPFDNSLFIDEVDVDFCLRAKINGFWVGQCFGVLMKHHIGKAMPFSFGKLSVIFALHSVQRMYYIVRNRIVMTRRYVCFVPLYELVRWRDLIAKIVLTFWLVPQKKAYFCAISSGVLDGICGRLGQHCIKHS